MAFDIFHTSDQCPKIASAGVKALHRMGRKKGHIGAIISALFISIFSAAHCLIYPGRQIQRNQGRSAPAAAATSTRAARRTKQLYLSRYRSPYKFDHWDRDDNGGYAYRQLAAATERPVLTLTAQDRSPTMEPRKRQKIVVLGASGKIGRLVIRHLMDSSVDATIVAFCRDYDKACRVLSDDLIAVQVNAQSQHRGPKLQIVEGEIAPPGTSHKQVQEIIQVFYNESSPSAASSEPDRSHPNIRLMDHPLLALAEAIHGANVVISCVGAVRNTHLWTDWIARPFWRILRPDVTSWCIDQRHPYYAHYLTTKIALQLAEGEEQARLQRQYERDEREKAHDQHESMRSIGIASTVSRNQREPHQKRMRFIRISDLCVSQRPWRFVPFMTNLLHSMVLRYQHMAEQLLQQSSVVETIVLRPGDLVSEHDHNAVDLYDYDRDDAGERDRSTTAVQVGIDGWLPEPSRIGRDDVAALAVAAALFDSKGQYVGERRSSRSWRSTRSISLTKSDHGMDVERSIPPDSDDVFHYTLACRWVGNQLHPYPPQGQMRDGHIDARVAMRQALTTLNRQAHYHRDESRQEPREMASKANLVPPKKRRRRSKPYGLIVSIPTYAMLYIIASRFASLAITTIINNSGMSQYPLSAGVPTVGLGLRWCVKALLVALQTVTGVFLSGNTIPRQYITL